jgi:hypothetical protein
VQEQGVRAGVLGAGVVGVCAGAVCGIWYRGGVVAGVRGAGWSRWCSRAVAGVGSWVGAGGGVVGAVVGVVDAGVVVGQ